MRRELVIQEVVCFSKPKLQKLAMAALRAHVRARDCAVKSVENMVRAGQSLRKLRELSDDNEWNAYLEHHYDGSERTVQRYMYLAKHWSLLQTVAPPEALTSQRKAMQLLQTLLYGEGPAAETTPKRRKRRATAALELKPAATSATEIAAPMPTAINADDEAGRSTVLRMREHLLRVLAELNRELSEIKPPHYLVSYALGAIHRAQRQCAEMERTSSDAETAAEQHVERDRRDSDGQTASSMQTRLEPNLDDDL